MFNPQERSQPITFFAFLFVACLLLCGIASAAPSITLSKKSGPPTSKILVSGRGFKPNVGVDIYFGTKDEALVVTNGKGQFDDAKIHAPREARPGQHWVTALERNNDKGAQQPFLVQTTWSQFHFDADGTRLNPYENVLNPQTVGHTDLKWSFATGDAVHSSPAVVDGVLYIGSDDFNVYALNVHTGATLWNYTTGYIVWSSPAVANGVVYVASDDFAVYALNASTGSLLWSYPTGSHIYASPAVANGVVYVGSQDGNIYALNASTGAKLWNRFVNGVNSTPAVVNGVVYVGALDYKVYALNAITGAKLWTYSTGYYVDSSPAVANGVVYIGSNDGKVYALNAGTGSPIWTYPTDAIVESTPAVANGVVYVAAENDTMYALNAATGSLLWRSPTGGASSPVVADGVVYVGSEDWNVYALNACNGAKLWSYPTGSELYSSPVVVNGVVYVGSLDKSVYAFGLPNGDQSIQAPESRLHVLSTLRPDFNLKVSQQRARPHSQALNSEAYRDNCRNQAIALKTPQ